MFGFNQILSFDRMIVCAELTIHDFSVIVHEMGHIQYFMTYKDQPTVFKVPKCLAFENAFELFLKFFQFFSK